MLIFILAIVIALVAWSLHLMQEAMEHHEFSLMLAGTLVAFAAAALVGVYFLMGDYMGYMARIDHSPISQVADYNLQLIVSSSEE
jgi:undecaprenyl pyrophosphate phosphatase UppP